VNRYIGSTKMLNEPTMKTLRPLLLGIDKTPGHCQVKNRTCLNCTLIVGRFSRTKNNTKENSKLIVDLDNKKLTIMPFPIGYALYSHVSNITKLIGIFMKSQE
jgi:hypothetical protein